MRHILLMFVGLCLIAEGFAQRTDRDFIRRGNKLYEDSLFVKAEVEYRRALDVNPQSMEAMYNLGNALLAQQKAEEAMKQFQAAASVIPVNGRNIAFNEADKEHLSKIYHNMGVLLQSSQQLDACIEAYKNSLRNNPRDHETRYNLTVALKQKHVALKQKQQQEQQQEQQQDQQEQEKEDLQEQQDQQKQEEKEQQNQQNQEQQEQQQQEQQQNMSKENAEQMLRAIMQDEKEIQEKVQKAMQEVQPRKFEKDW